MIIFREKTMTIFQVLFGNYFYDILLFRYLESPEQCTSECLVDSTTSQGSPFIRNRIQILTRSLEMILKDELSRKLIDDFNTNFWKSQDYSGQFEISNFYYSNLSIIRTESQSSLIFFSSRRISIIRISL